MIRLGIADIRAAAQTLAGAFGDDPFSAYLPRQGASRQRRVFPCFGCVVRYGVLFGEAYAASPNMEGVAVWLPPQETNPSPAKMLKAGVARLPWTAGIGCSLRFWKLQRHLSNVWQRYGDFPHWYLALLGVAPQHQGQGHASKLVAAMLDRCDKEGLRCCVDTEDERNIAFYRRFGFSLIHQAPVPKTTLECWFMARPCGRQ